MNARLLFLTTVLSLSCLFLQAVTPEQLMKLKPSFIQAYLPHGSNDSLLELPMDFNSATLHVSALKKGLEGRSIKKITLYYSVYRLADKFDQPLLNLERFKNLQACYPFLFRSSVIEWHIVGQLAGATADAAKHLFHGFVIEMQPPVTREHMIAEIARIDRFAMSDSLGKDTIYYVEKTWIRKKKKWTGYFLPRSSRKQQSHLVYRERSIWKRRKQYITLIDTVKTKTPVRQFLVSTHAIAFVNRNISDSTVMAALNRNRHWKNMVFIVDVTGSMSPYSNQLFMWYKLNSLKRSVKDFTFFNDGDNKADGQKKIGKTGGLYHTPSGDPNKVIEAGRLCMQNGGGGDAPENNCEALLAAQERNPEATEFFMIADNWANMRDTALISRIKKPVHIILCGVHNNYFNTDYLNLARRTGGSLHTIDQDIDHLLQLAEGEKINIGPAHYIIRKGKFELLSEI